MKTIKSLAFSSFLALGIILISSCSKACEDSNCDYGGVCENDDCVCIDVSEAYLIGTWEYDNGAGSNTFNADNTFSDNFGSALTWSLDLSTNRISLDGAAAT